MISTSGLRLYFLTASSLASITYAAPSLIPEAFPAVTVPSFLKTARSVPNFSKEVLRFGYSSLSKTTTSRPILTSIGTTSSAKRPSSTALIAFC